MKASRLVPRKARQIARGWLKPSAENAKRFARLAGKKAEREFPTDRIIIRDKTAKSGFRVEKQAFRRKAVRKNEILSRIAATAALDAIGIGRSKKEKESRERILSLAKRISFTRSRRVFKEISQTSEANTLQRIKREVEKELGKARARLFYARYVQVLKKMERQEAKA